MPLQCFFIVYEIQVSARDSGVARLKYGRKNMQGIAVVKSSVDGPLIAHRGARARYLPRFPGVIGLPT